MTPANKRKAAERQRRKDAGLVRREVWVKPDQVKDLQAFVADLAEDDALEAVAK